MPDLQLGSLSVSSNVNTEEQIRESLNVPRENEEQATTAQTEAPPAELPSTDPQAESTETEPVRDDQGRFVKKEKPRDNPQARISQAVARQREAEAKVAAYEARIAALEAKINGNGNGHAPQVEPLPQPAATRTKPVEDEIGSKYASYADFAEDLADWKFEQRMAALQIPKPEAIAANVRQQLEYDAILAEFNERASEGRKKYHDYDTAIESADKILQAAGMGLSPVMADAIVRSAHSADITYWLATHPDQYLQLARETASLDVTAAAMVRRVLEQAGSAGDVRGAAPVPQVSSAKPPIKPLGASAVTTDSPPGDEASAAEHARYWNRKLKVPGTQPR